MPSPKASFNGSYLYLSFALLVSIYPRFFIITAHPRSYFPKRWFWFWDEEKWYDLSASEASCYDGMNEKRGKERKREREKERKREREKERAKTNITFKWLTPHIKKKRTRKRDSFWVRLQGKEGIKCGIEK